MLAVVVCPLDLEFFTSKSKKSLAFAELMSNLPQIDDSSMVNDSLPYESWNKGPDLLN